MMLSCKETTELSTEAREGALEGLDRWRYRFHMTVCPACKAYARGLDIMLRVLRESPPSVAPDDVRSAALGALRARRSG